MSKKRLSRDQPVRGPFFMLLGQRISETMLPCRRQLDFRIIQTPRSASSPLFRATPDSIINAPVQAPARFTTKQVLRNRAVRGPSFFPLLQNRCSHAGASSIFEERVFALREPILGPPFLLGLPGLQKRCSRVGASSILKKTACEGPARSRTFLKPVLVPPGLHSGTPGNSESVLPCRRQLDFRKKRVCVPGAYFGTSGPSF